MSYQHVCSLDTLAEGQGKEFLVGSRIIAIFRIADAIFAVDGICAHQGGPIAKGRLDGNCVTCPWHGWQYDVTCGQHLLTKKKMLECFPTEIRGEEVWVDADANP